MNHSVGNQGRRYSALYFKAQEIMKISRRISDYLTPDLASLNENGSESRYVYFTGDIIRQSQSLIWNISKAENEFFQDSRSRYISSVSKLTDRLFRNCENLEYANSDGKEFLPILRKELLKFRKLQRTWRLTL
ncbi:hypothetical protein [Christiangramia aestuarii]|uniref:Four helix bundle protein n=1 Tax=Christiangramia aestuarii TaxID=1028746 RepID=A0A7K1LM10_9FLAO|nr:hypothetical protein [Christiangramia aestuarii]